MSGLTKFGSPTEKKRGLLSLFILHTLDKSPQSGYDLLKEIGEKTHGMWVPSKGTIYPVLHKLEEDGLIAVQDTGKRSRVVYGLTLNGREMLENIRKRGRESHQQLELYKDLIVEIFAHDLPVPRRLLFEIHTALVRLPLGADDRAAQILKHCITELQRIHEECLQPSRRRT